MAMDTRWRSRDVALALPEPILRAMWERARRSCGVDQGGCYDARPAATLLLWSDPLNASGAHPIGAVSVRWHAPAPDRATIHRIAWTTDHPAREAQLWRAVEVLAGADWPLIQSALSPATTHPEAA